MSIVIPAAPTVLLLTALPVEMGAVLSQVTGTGSQMVGPVLCEIRRFEASNGLPWRVVAAELGPGTVDTAGAVVATTAEFRPDVLMFVGIAGALKADVAIGDVVAGTEVAWTERGKWSESGYIPRIRTVSLSVPLSQRARQVAREGTWTSRLREPRAGVKAVVQQIASGEKVVADDNYRAWLQATFSDAYAIENEGFALARAAEVYADGQRYVVRGISDAADGTKSDQGQPDAAEAAAAFSFALLDAYSSAQATAVSAAPTTLPEGSGPQGEVEGAVGDITTLARDLVVDVDLLDDDRDQVEELARDVADRYEDADLANLLRHVGAALGGDVGPLIWRRLFWFGRQLLRSAATRLPNWHLEESVKSAPLGMAFLLTEPGVWSRCPEAARRRCLTALLGPPDPLSPPSALAISYLAPLLRAAAVNEREAARVRSSFDLAPLDLLFANGVTFDMLGPRILDDLDSGEFGRQNTAARFLYQLPPGTDQSLDPESDFSLGAKLVEATMGIYHSFGADEAMSLSYVSTWPLPRLIGGIWAALASFDGQYLRMHASPHLPTLIAAAAGKNALKEVLDHVRSSLDSSLDQTTDVGTSIGEDVFNLAGKYTGPDQEWLNSFGSWLSTRQSQ